MRRPPRSGSAWASDQSHCGRVNCRRGTASERSMGKRTARAILSCSCQLPRNMQWRQVAARMSWLPGCCCSAVATNCLHGRALVTAHTIV